MPHRRAKTVVSAPPSEVFPEVVALWLITMEQTTPGPVAVGTRFATHTDKVLYFDVARFEAPTVFELRIVQDRGAGPAFGYRFDIAPHPAGSFVNASAGVSYSVFYVVFKMGLFAPFMFAWLYAIMRKLDLAELLATLKQRAESGI
jgi:hypothetical protein